MTFYASPNISSPNVDDIKK